MSDIPDYVLFFHPENRPEFPDFPHSLVLVPNEPSDGSFNPIFLVEPHSTSEVLNGAALPEYMKRHLPIRILARRARDLRPFLKRRDSFLRRGYTIKVQS
jgi:hypothetical protein